ncbi:MAG: 4a-hydroxytetrahydrobiopterin dehydratase [Deltaproteobacteria bacterium]|nr:4a-hydroxytetrahydrobiopterin dehydratase [Deltaproteobacteria bacterium]
MNQRVKRTCGACSADAPSAPNIEKKQFRKEHPDWQFIEEDGVDKIRRAYSFENYTQSVNFTDEVAALAEFEDHHPSILLEWGRVTVCWWTHKIGGIHMNDLLMARETDHLYNTRID